MTEDEFIKSFNLSDKHCNTCHADSETMDLDMCTIFLSNDDEVEVCCVVAIAYQEKNQ